MFKKIKFNKIHTGLFSTLLLLFFMLFLFSNKALAYNACSGNECWGSNYTNRYPSDLQSYFASYDNPSNNQSPCLSFQPKVIGIYSWISVNQGVPPANFTNKTYSISSSNPTGVNLNIPLQLNIAYLVCHTKVYWQYFPTRFPRPAYSPLNPQDGPLSSPLISSGEYVIKGITASTGINGTGQNIPGTFTGVNLLPGTTANTATQFKVTENNYTKYWLGWQDFSFVPSVPVTQSFYINYTDITVNNNTDGSAYCVASSTPPYSPSQVNRSLPWWGCKSTTTSVLVNVTIGGGSGTPNNCPGFPNYKNVSVSMPYTGLSSSAHSSTTIQSYPASLYQQYIPLGVNETSISDISIGGLRITPTIVSNPTTTVGSPSATISSSGSITLDYSPYVQTYPYDFNQPQVNYNNIYNEVDWTPSFTGYSCSSGDPPPSGASCTHTVTNYIYYNYQISPPSSCLSLPPYTLYTVTYGNTTYCDYTYSYTYTINYSALYDYNWIPSTPFTVYSPTYITGQQMTPCFNRTFTLNPTSSIPALGILNGGSFNPNYEHPNDERTVVPLQYSFGVPLGDPATNFRMPSQLNGVTVNTIISQKHSNPNSSINNETLNYSLCNNTQQASVFTDSGSGQSILQNMTFDCRITTDDENLADFVAGDYAEFNGDINYASGTLVEQSPGSFNPTSTTNQSLGPNDTNPVHTKPYLKVNGGDVITSIDSQNSGSCIGNSAIYTWNQGGPNYNGSGTTLAVITGGLDNGFSSNQKGSIIPSGLVFSNNPITGGYGGNFCGSSAPATTTNYLYNQLNAAYPTVSTSAPSCLSISGGINKTCIYNYGNNPISIPALNIVSGGHVVIFGNAAINITGNIIFDSSGNNSYLANPYNIPSLEIVTNNSDSSNVDNNPINIANNVTRLDGIYIASNSSINDCIINNFPPSQANDFYDIRDPSSPSFNQSCAQQLVVNGAMEASQINFYRTFDSLYEAGNSDNDRGSTQPQTSAAEIINYSPLVWLAPNNLTGLYPGQQTPVIQSITSLAPIVSQ